MCRTFRGIILSFILISLVACGGGSSGTSGVQGDELSGNNVSDLAIRETGFNLAQKVAYTTWTPANDTNSAHAPPYLQQADFALVVVLAELSKVWSHGGMVNPSYAISVSGLGSREGRIVAEFDDYAFTDFDLRLLDGKVTLSMDFRNVYETGPELANWNRLNQVRFHNLLVSGAQAYFVDGTLGQSSSGPHNGTRYDVSITNAITRERVSFEDLNALYAFDAPNFFQEANHLSGRIDFGEHGVVSLSPSEVAFCDGCDQDAYLAVEMRFPDSVDAFKVFKPSQNRIRISSELLPFDLLLDDSNILGEEVAHVAPEIGAIRFVESDILDQLVIDSVSAEDPDGDPFLLEYEWYVNGVHVHAADNSLSLDREHYVGGDHVEVKVIASDQFHASERSLLRVVPNSRPELDEELFSSPMSLVVGESFEIDASAAFDADGEPLSYAWSVSNAPWTRGEGLTFSPSSNSSVVSVTAESQGEQTVRLEISDGAATIWKSGVVNVEAMALFDERVDVGVPARNLEIVLIEDVTGDDRLDVVVGTLPENSNQDEAGILVFVQQNDGTLARPRFYGAGFTSHAYYMNAIDSGDFNGDGRMDIVTTHEDGMAIWYQTNSGALSGPTIKPHFGSAGNSGELVAGDFTGDRRDDILSFSSSTHTELLKQYSDHSLSSAIPVALGLGGYSTPTKIDEDIDNNGLVDIVTWSNDQSRQIHAYEITDSGIAHRVLYDFGDDTPQGTLQVADINDDGLQDILINISKSAEQRYVVAVLLQDETNAFQISEEMNFYIPNGIDQIETGDFNGDERLDIVAVTRGYSSISIYLQSEDGSFMNKQTYPVAFNSGDKGKLSVGDISGDGKDDIVVVNARTLQVYYGK